MSLEQENQELKKANAELAARLAATEAQLQALTARVAELEGCLAQNSRNSSQPPSSDGYKRSPKKRSLKKASGKASGGQKGHPGHQLEQVANPDTVVFHFPAVCEGCQADLSAERGRVVSRRQVFELPPLKLSVTEHRTYARECRHCHTTTLGAFPKFVSQATQYGPAFRALAVYLNQYQLIPYARTTEILNELFSENVSQGTLVNLLAECYEQLEATEQTIKTQLGASAVLHCDETSAVVAGTRQWFHVTSNAKLTHYAVDPKRGKAATTATGILPDFKGVAVHDGWASYQKYECEHALCNAHHLRELTFVHEQLDQTWALEFKELLVEIKDAVSTAKVQGLKQLAAPDLAHYQLRYHKLLMAGLLANPPPLGGWPRGKAGRPKQSKPKNLLDRLHYQQKQVLAFACDFKVPFDNNQAERDLRMLKVQQKIAGCFRTIVGAQHFCRIRSYISSVPKQGHNPFTALFLAFIAKPIPLA